ncbi:MAG: Fpg/Nei family DNA glycosylase, partial [Solirubrobacteraceae bacterium]
GQLGIEGRALAEFPATRLGGEPFSQDFTAARLRTQARGSRAPIKAFLLNQRQIAGVGNIYADEALHRARIHPLRPAGRLTLAQWNALAVAIRVVLRAGIDAGGATIDDFRDLDGARGAFQERFLVHRRAGEPCPLCGTPIRKLVAAGRGTYVCERCQPRPRRSRPR